MLRIYFFYKQMNPRTINAIFRNSCSKKATKSQENLINKAGTIFLF